jgi:serine/threonine protein kinase
MSLSQDGNIHVHKSSTKAPKSVDRGVNTMNEMMLASKPTLLATAKGVVQDLSSRSNVFDAEREAMIPKFDPREVITGHVLGRGGFCVCSEIEKIKPLPDRKNNHGGLDSNSQHTTGSEGNNGFAFRIFNGRKNSEFPTDPSQHGQYDTILSREYVISRARKTRRNKKCEYVFKSVSTSVDKITFMKGHVDIAMEAKYLSVLNHRNIIELSAVSSMPPCSMGYFLVLERLEETLGKRIKTWMDRERMSKGIGGCFGGAKRLSELYIERIGASYDVASALFYLHSHNILFRDIKPENIGFSSNGILKLFDFGLAKELQPQDKLSDGTYKNMTGMTGAIRYMSPEVGLGKPYNLAADTYSWAMLTWFILALEPPFGLYTENMIIERAMIKGSRPGIFKSWSNSMKELMKSAWDPVISARPSFLEISLVLKQELINGPEGGDSRISKSTSTSVTSPEDCKTKEVGLSDDSENQYSYENSHEH